MHTQKCNLFSIKSEGLPAPGTAVSMCDCAASVYWHGLHSHYCACRLESRQWSRKCVIGPYWDPCIRQASLCTAQIIHIGNEIRST